MFDWILNPEGVSSGSYIVLWIGFIVILPIAVVIGLVKARKGKREGE